MKYICSFAREVYVFDHHKSATETIAQYPKEVICHCDPGSKLAGCELTWEYLFPNDYMPLAVRLIGDRDTWSWKYGTKTAKFTEGLHLYPNQPEDEIWNELLDDEGNKGTIHRILHDGEICLKYRDNKFKGFRDAWGYGVKIEVECPKCYGAGRTSCNEAAERDDCTECNCTGKKSYTCYVINIMFHDAVSEMFGEKIDEFDICAATVYKNGFWKISFRSNKVDVSKIAQKFGGGGHAGAAGAENLTVLPWENVK